MILVFVLAYNCVPEFDVIVHNLLSTRPKKEKYRALTTFRDNSVIPIYQYADILFWFWRGYYWFSWYRSNFVLYHHFFDKCWKKFCFVLSMDAKTTKLMIYRPIWLSMSVQHWISCAKILWNVDIPSPTCL